MAYTNEQLGKALEDLTAAYVNFVEKAKEAAIAAMGDTVVKQIKQDAKDFIAAELKTQRDTLIQAIENAKLALKNGAVEAGNKLEQYTAERKKELAALITASEAALKEKVAEILKNIQASQENTETKCKEIAASSKLETENAVLQAKKDLEEQGKAVSLKIGGEMKEQLNTFGETLGKKIADGNAAVEKTFIAETKKLNEKLDAEMSSLKDFLLHKDAVNTIIINWSDRHHYGVAKINNLLNGPLKNRLGAPIINVTEKFKLTDFLEENGRRDYLEIYTNTVTSIHFWDLRYDQDIKIKIHNFYFLEHIYIYTARGDDRSFERIKEKIKITDCPNFKGFKKIDN